MFTGLIAEVGEVAAIESTDAGARLQISAGLVDALGDGDSVAVAGVCLTVAGRDGGSFAADVMNQTLELTSLGGLAAGAPVNLEPALRADGRLGGHIVGGHVDGIAEVISAEPDGFARRLTVALPEPLRRYVVERGSIALDGVSLTVSALGPETAQVSLIPETLERTTLGKAAVGARLNIEVDIVARYAERLLQAFTSQDGG